MQKELGISELYNDLTLAYSDENLNKISAKLIHLYKSKNYSGIREIANKISRYIPIDEEHDAKCFSKLIMLYHPDKANHYRSEIHNLYTSNNLEGLQQYSHIFLASDIENIAVLPLDDEIDYNPEFSWDIQENDGYSYEETIRDDLDTEEIERSVYNAIKIREYGRMDIEFPSYYLEDFEEFELSYSGIELLDGIEYCKHVKILDLSNNEISDLSLLWNLESLEELYLENNQIGFIDSLSNLLHLKILDISENQIDDITPLMDLEMMEYLNVTGNQVPAAQIQKMREKGVIVID